ncbi:MAG: formylglycine-generating enzyme family protein [Chloroflexi bacterium]|nr:formylglycine-generating enzyme family protein [Chloroflexota bacterium]
MQCAPIRCLALTVVTLTLFVTCAAGCRGLSSSVGSDSSREEIARLATEIAALRGLAAAGDEVALADALDRAMVAIPAGEFIMGSDAGRADERPAHRVYLDAFELDRYEVTNAQYRRFMLATGERPPRCWTDNTYPAGQADYPVVGVSWDGADAYCRWAGKRLPTEAEWEKACRGTEGRVYPWGDAWEPGRANVDAAGWDFGGATQDATAATVWDAAWARLALPPGSAGPTLEPVGSHLDGAGPYGVLDMVGNSSEWVADWYNWADYSKLPLRNPLVVGPPWNHCLRGSAWADPTGEPAWTQSLSRCSARNSAHETSDPRVGFRCARSGRSE